MHLIQKLTVGALLMIPIFLNAAVPNVDLIYIGQNDGPCLYSRTTLKPK